MQVLEAYGISHDYGLRPLFEGLELVLEEGERVGLVGANGSGKSTLMRIIAGLEEPLAGEVLLQPRVRLAYLPQEPEFFPGTTVYAALEEGLAGLVALREEYEEVTARLLGRIEAPERRELTTRAQRLHDILGNEGAWDLRPRIEETITLLGLPPAETVLDLQSGGTRKRVALGKALLAEPDLLLLDEPTNHLDTRTVAWLERRLQTFRGTLVLVTHDRYFLEAVVGRILEVSCGKLASYPGNYSAYLEAKGREWELAQRRDEKRLKLLARELEWLRQGAKARTTKQKARVERVAKLSGHKGLRKDKPVELLFDPQQRLGHTILKAHRVGKRYGDRPLFGDFSLELLGGERIGIIGPNGCGKTTLLRLLIGELEPDSGYIKQGVNTRLAYFDQQRAQLDPNATIWDSVVPGGDHVLVSSQKLHKKAFLASFLFPAEMQRIRVGLLSGGERNRLLLARLMLEGANVLVLDEPTNDLDLRTLEVLEEQLSSFPRLADRGHPRPLFPGQGDRGDLRVRGRGSDPPLPGQLQLLPAAQGGGAGGGPPGRGSPQGDRGRLPQERGAPDRQWIALPGKERAGRDGRADGRGGGGARAGALPAGGPGDRQRCRGPGRGLCPGADAGAGAGTAVRPLGGAGAQGERRGVTA